MIEPLRIAVLGMIVRFPAGGLTWHYLHYVLGLRRLGHDVRFVETSSGPDECWDPVLGAVTSDASFGVDYAHRTFNAFDGGHQWMYFDSVTGRWHGDGRADAETWLGSVDVVINVSGVTPLQEWVHRVPVRLLVDTDPGFTQVRNIQNRRRMDYALQHTHFATFGENIAGQACAIPADGLPWMATRQPIALDHWPPVPSPPGAGFTTVMYWDSYEPLEHGDLKLGMKSHSFPEFQQLPSMVSEPLAMSVERVPPATRAEISSCGWRLDRAGSAAEDPWTYQRYITGAKAEFTVAKSGYVATRSGWFSERSACFLASGKPVVTQDTGFGGHLPTGAGLIAVSTAGEAAAAVTDVSRRYDFHSRAARRLAEEYFDSGAVLTRLLDELGSAEKISTDGRAFR